MVRECSLDEPTGLVAGCSSNANVSYPVLKAEVSRAIGRHYQLTTPRQCFPATSVSGTNFNTFPLIQ